jgi:predicted transcriptional regulator YdeE
MRIIGRKRPIDAAARTAPHILRLEEPIQIVGLGVETSVRTIHRDVPRLGRQLRTYKRAHDIPNRKEPWVFAAVSSGFEHSSGTFFYFIGDVVTGLGNVPDGLTGLEIPAIQYAVFPVRPRHRWDWPRAIAATKKYAYGTWLPQSEYELAGEIDDFEHHDARSVRSRGPEIDLYVAVRPRTR